MLLVLKIGTDQEEHFCDSMWLRLRLNFGIPPKVILDTLQDNDPEILTSI